MYEGRRVGKRKVNMIGRIRRVKEGKGRYVRRAKGKEKEEEDC